MNHRFRNNEEFVQNDYSMIVLCIQSDAIRAMSSMFTMQLELTSASVKDDRNNNMPRIKKALISLLLKLLTAPSFNLLATIIKYIQSQIQVNLQLKVLNLTFRRVIANLCLERSCFMKKISATVVGVITLGLFMGIACAEPLVIPLWDDLKIPADAGEEVTDNTGHVRNVHNPEITVYLPDKDKANGTAVLICPGGGYGVLSMQKEGVEIAQWLNSLGVAGIVIKNRLKEYGHPAPLNDAQRAMKIIRSKAAEFNIDPDRLGVCGFSAGGHLASCVTTLYHSEPLGTDDPLDKFSDKPNFSILIYPVISMQKGITHGGSRFNLLGNNPSQELVDRMSTDQQVTSQTPPTFLAHASDDGAVRPLNSILFYNALIDAKVPAELHIYEKGGHGFGMRPENGIAAANWPVRCEAWMKQRRLLDKK